MHRSLIITVNSSKDGFYDVVLTLYTGNNTPMTVGLYGCDRFDAEAASEAALSLREELWDRTTMGHRKHWVNLVMGLESGDLAP